MKNYYAILEISENADEQEIKKAYRRLAKKYHPDVVKDDTAKKQKMYDIQEAYECLGDVEKKKKYDETRKKQASSMRKGTPTPDRQKNTSGQSGKPGQNTVPNMGQFEQFFGFQPGKGMETYQDKRVEKNKKQGVVCPEEMFMKFFGIRHEGKGGGGR